MENTKFVSDATFVRFGFLVVNIESVESVYVTPDLKRCTIVFKSGESRTNESEDAAKIWEWWCGKVADVLAK
jgi:hypothetical protein